MATGRYFSFDFYPYSGVTYSVQGIELYDVAGGTDQAFGITTGATSNFPTPANCFDHNPATVWTGTANGFITVDFGTSKSVDQIIMRTDSANEFAFVIVLVSDDNTNWRCIGVPQSPAVAGAVLTWDTTAQLAYPQMTAIPRFEQNAAGTVYGLGSVHRIRDARNDLFGGKGFIAGVTDILGVPDVPVGRKVRLHLVSNGILVDETWSDPVTGAYRFDNLAIQPYYVMTFDYQHSYNAVVKDGIMPVLS